MKQLSPTQNRILVAFGLFDLMIALVLIGLIFANIITLPIFIPLLFSISAITILFLGLKN